VTKAHLHELDHVDLHKEALKHALAFQKKNPISDKSSELRQRRNPKIVTGSSSDPTEWQLYIGTKRRQEHLAKRMKDLNDPLEIVKRRESLSGD